jgi:hypothetical protein
VYFRSYAAATRAGAGEVGASADDEEEIGEGRRRRRRGRRKGREKKGCDGTCEGG